MKRLKHELVIPFVGIFGLVAGLMGAPWMVSAVADGSTWTIGASAQDNNWSSVAYGNGMFVAVAKSGSQRVMTSTDGVNWSARSAATNASGSQVVWNSVTFGNGRFVAVGSGSMTMRTMSSSDGITWAPGPEDLSCTCVDSFESVTYGNGIYVAISSNNGFGTSVITSSDGANWTRRSIHFSQWQSVTFGNGLFVAVGNSGTQRVATSSDGIVWTARTASINKSWKSITFGNGLFVAVGGMDFYDGPGMDRVMTSTDGINWTTRTAAEANPWWTVTYGDGLFVAVSWSGTNRVMTSPDGISWTSRSAAVNNGWTGVTYGDGLFVAVSEDGNGDRVMTSGTFIPPPTTTQPPPDTTAPGTDSSIDVELPFLRIPPAGAIERLPLRPVLLLSGSQVTRGQLITVSEGGFIPGEYVQLVIALPVRILGFGYSDSQGDVTLTGTIPSDLSDGEHSLALYAPESGLGSRQLIALADSALPQTE